ncbi:MAG TPA: PKD domain-containing protein, partial [Chitinophagales bacterium]|nr:PKD domain-containing protein [Chitinophagales bacterium]
MNRQIINILLFFLCSIFCSQFIFSQTSFQKTFGGTGDDVAYSLCNTVDGGWALAGYTASFGSGGWDVYMIKIDSLGDVQWTKTFGGSSDDVANCILQTNDGGYILAGNTESFGSGRKDAFVIKTDGNGTLQWSNTFGGFDDDNFQSAFQTDGGDYIFGGYTISFGSGYMDFFIVKTSANGSLLWSRAFGGWDYEYTNCIVETIDSGYMAAGSTLTYGAGLYDNYLVKISPSGNIQWNKTIGGAAHDGIRTVRQLSTGDYVMTGNTYSFAAGIRDMYLVKTNINGSLKWSKTFGGTGDDHAWTVQPTSDFGFICVGFTTSYGSGSNDVFLVKTDSLGNMQWSKTYGGSAYDDGWYVIEVPNRGYIIAGYTSSFGAGGKDVYLIKTDVNGNVCCNMTTANSITNSPSSLVSIPAPFSDSSAVSSSAALVSNIPNSIVQVLCSEPNADFFVDDTSICENNCINFTDSSSSNPTSWRWTFAGASPASSTSQNPSNICYSASGNYNVSLIASNGTCSDTLTRFITVNPNPDVVASPDTTLCNHQSVTLNAAGGGSYLWSPPTFLNCTTCQNPTAAPDQSVTYIVTVTDSNGCTASDSLSLTVLSPKANFTADDSAICLGGCVDFNDLSMNHPISFWQWTFAGATPSSAMIQNPGGICYPTPGMYDVTLIISSGNCFDTLLKPNHISVSGPAPISVSASESAVEQGESVQLNVSGGDSYLWSPDSQLSCTNCNNPVAVMDESTTFYVFVTDTNGCITSDSVAVTVVSKCERAVKMPSAFSPNHDHVNDFIKPFVSSAIDNFSMSIFNRWGQLVFRSSSPD